MVVKNRVELFLALFSVLVFAGSSTYRNPIPGTYTGSSKNSYPLANKPSFSAPVFDSTAVVAQIGTPVWADIAETIHFLTPIIVTNGTNYDYYYRYHTLTSTWDMDNLWAAWVHDSAEITVGDSILFSSTTVTARSAREWAIVGLDGYQSMVQINDSHFYYSPWLAPPAYVRPDTSGPASLIGDVQYTYACGDYLSATIDTVNVSCTYPCYTDGDLVYIKYRWECIAGSNIGYTDSTEYQLQPLIYDEAYLREFVITANTCTNICMDCTELEMYIKLKTRDRFAPLNAVESLWISFAEFQLPCGN